MTTANDKTTGNGKRRSGRKGRARIPEPLWKTAVKMAEIHGVNRAATAVSTKA